MPDSKESLREQVEQALNEQFDDRVFRVEAGKVWVSGMNANCHSLANRMAQVVIYQVGAPASLIYDDDAVEFGGVQFNYGEAA